MTRSPFPGNPASALFRQLAAAWNQDAAAHRVDVLAANLASMVARSPSPVCVGMLERDAAPRYYGLVFLLDGWGVTLRKTHRRDGLASFLYLERRGEAPAECIGTVVREINRVEEVA